MPVNAEVELFQAQELVSQPEITKEMVDLPAERRLESKFNDKPLNSIENQTEIKQDTNSSSLESVSLHCSEGVNTDSPDKINKDEQALIEMIEKLPNPEKTIAKLNEKQCKKLQSASKRIEKQVNSDI